MSQLTSGSAGPISAVLIGDRGGHVRIFTEFGSLDDFISGNIALLRTGAAHWSHAGTPRVAVVQTMDGNVTVDRGPQYEAGTVDYHLFFTE